MKKTLRWMMLMGIMAICSVTYAQTASNEYLDIANYATIDEAGINQDAIDKLYSYDEATNTLVVSVFGAYQSKVSQTWVTTEGSGSSGRTWDATGVFNGSGYYHTTTTAKTASARADRIFFFKVKGIESVSALVKSGGSSRSAVMTVLDGEEEVETVSDNTNKIVAIGIDGLDKDKVYTVKLTGSDASSNSDIYEVAFTGPFEQEPVINVEEGEVYSFSWNFSNWTLGDITAKTTVDGLTVEATSSKKVTIDENGKTVDGVSYTQRLKFGGTGASDSRNVHFEVPGSCSIIVIGCSASGDTDRTLNIHEGSFGNVKGTLPMPCTGPVVGIYNYEGGTTTIYLSSANSGVNLYAIYVESATKEITLSQYGISTFYFGETAYQIPEGITAYTIDEISGRMLKTLEVSDYIPANCGVIIEGTPNQTYTFYKATGDIPEQHSLLRGSDKTEETTGDDPEGSYKFYMLSAKNGNVGFYYGANGGAAFMNQANKAYLAVPMEDAAGITEFVFDGFDGITAVEAEPSTTSTATYNLAGQRVGADYKGVVISGNKKYIRK